MDSDTSRWIELIERLRTNYFTKVDKVSIVGKHINVYNHLLVSLCFSLMQVYVHTLKIFNLHTLNTDRVSSEEFFFMIKNEGISNVNFIHKSIKYIYRRIYINVIFYMFYSNKVESNLMKVNTF